MAVLFRVTSYFVGKKQGWSETLCYPGVSMMHPQVWWNTIGINIAQKRADLLAREFQLDAVRVAKIRDDALQVVKRNSLLVTTNMDPSGQTVKNAGEQANLCVIITGTDIDGTRKKQIFMGGIPDEISINGGELDPGGALGWGGRFNAWAVLVLAAQGGWLQDIVNLGPVGVAGYTVAPNMTVNFTFADPLFLVGETGKVRKIRVKGLNNGSRLNGELLVTVTGTETAVTKKALAVFPYSFGGEATSYTAPQPFISAAAWNTNAIRTRQRGRPSYVTRGRAPAQARG